ncbi:MFS transporter [Asticcacaulis sp. BYS171W]|uniref:MFS transporter n=1 Tax=Asticcacaulis aquaticus TaxID=2984212 RepID=A0ABT5HQK1_9CAUL|nr:MFS transporter [Asticcacaulis aquaticus]MDC7682346.1 MFS transporter [Asticcacaulis aquaticus]
MNIPAHWRHIILLWLIGVLAAAELGKFASLAPVIREDLGLSLVQAGWLVSLIETGGATQGLIAGLLIGRLGSRKALIIGVTLLTVAGIAEALSASVWPLFAARVVESAGYLLIVIAAPSLITHVARPQDQAHALTLWSTFVPAGFAIGMILSGIALTLSNWTGALWLWAMVAVVALIAAWRSPPMEIKTDTKFSLPVPAVWLLCGGFGFYTTLFVGLIAMFPAFLIAHGLTPTSAATVTGIASAVTLGGAWVAGQALHSGDRARWIALGGGLLIPAALSLLIFAGGHPLWLSVLIVALNAVSGIASSIVFARLPKMSPVFDAAAANGVLTQFGAGGSLIGPPLLAFIAGHLGWSAVGLAVVVGSLCALGLMVLAERMARRAMNQG